MERQRFRRMGLSTIIGLMSLAVQSGNKSLENLARGAFGGGYTNAGHGWAGKRHKFKSTGITPRRSKAQRRARSANG